MTSTSSIRAHASTSRALISFPWAIRYRKEWGENWEFGGGVGYEKSRDENQQNSGGGLNSFKRDIDEWAGMASLKHKPTGLFVFGAFSTSESNDSNRQNGGVFTGTSSPDMSAWDARIGIQRKMGALGALGETSFFGGYLQINDGIGGACGAHRSCGAGTFPDLAIQTEITGAEVTRWYLGFDQSMVNGYLHLYGVYQHLEPDVDLVDSALNKVSEPLDDFDLHGRTHVFLSESSPFPGAERAAPLRGRLSFVARRQQVPWESRETSMLADP
jgi:hypothetical protein